MRAPVWNSRAPSEHAVRARSQSTRSEHAVRARPCVSCTACSKGVLRLRATLASLLFAACSSNGGSSDDPDDPTGPPPPPPPPVSSAFAGGWTGTTSQGRPVAMHIDDAGIALIMVGWSMSGIGTGCPTGIVSLFPFEAPATPLAITAGSFTYTSTLSTGNRIMAGTVTAAGSASGTLVVNDSPCGGTVNATWTATKATAASVDLTGSWNGSFRSSLVPQTSGTLFLVQSGSTLTGTYSVPSTSAGGTVSGTVLGQTARFTLTQTAPAGCAGLFNGHAVLLTGQNPVLFFYYSGADCLGVHTLGSGTGTRQAAAAR